MLNAGQEHSWGCHPEHPHVALHMAWASHNMEAGLWEKAAWEQVFQEAGSEAAGPVNDDAWNFPGITSPIFYWSESHRACPELRGWRNRLHLLMREWQGHNAQDRCGGVGDITAAIFGKYNAPYWNNDDVWTEACTKPYKKGERDAKEEHSWALPLGWLLEMLSLHLRELSWGTFKTTYW